MRFCLVWAGMFGLSTFAPSAAAQSTRSAPEEEEPTEISIEEVVRLVRHDSAAAQAIRARAALADANVDLAGVYPNPELGYVWMGRFRGTNEAINGTQHQAWVDVPLLLARQHRMRRRVAEGEALAAHAGLEVELLLLEVEARRAFFSLLVNQDRSERLERASAELETFEQLVEQRGAAGAQSRYDSARVRLELSRVGTALASSRADVSSAQARLAALVGRPGWAPRAAGSLDMGGTSRAAGEELPAVRAAQLDVEAAKRDVRRARAERVPEVRLGVGAYVTTDPNSASAYGGVSIPLPIFDTGRAAVRKAGAEREAAVAERDAIERELRARLSGTLGVLRERRQALERFDRETFAQIPEMQQMSEASYRLGGSSVFELLDAFRTRVELELARIELMSSVIDAELDVLAIAGR